MSKIAQLIEKYCPEGVEYRSFFEVCDYIRGITYNKNDEVNNGSDGIKVLRANNITLESNTLNFDDVKIVQNNVKVKESQWLKKGDVLICAGSGSKEHIGKVAYVFQNINCSFGGFMGVVRPKSKKLLTGFLFHILTSDMFKKHLAKASGSQSSTINNINNDTWKNFFIPVPPLPVQEEIVRILDSFTSLEAELEAELEARRKQYEYYRDKLLSFSEIGGVARQVRWMKMSEIAAYRKERVSVSTLNENNYVGVENLLQNRQGKTVSKSVPKEGNHIGYKVGDILIGNIRPYLKKIWYADIEGGTNGDVLPIYIKPNSRKSIIPKFLYHILSADNFFNYNMQYAKGAKMPRGDKDAIMNYPVNLPPLAEQERIVAILDKFDALVNDISTGLPAEIEARRKQYEYYRDKLLTF